MKFVNLTLAACLIATSIGCDARKSAKGFSLPDGDAQRGQQAFVTLQCHACHTVSGVDLPEVDRDLERSVALGGEVARLKTYGELVTSIINPSHRISKRYAKEIVETEGQSKMKNYNEVLTVSQLIDLVAFLEDHYRIAEYSPTEYPDYPYLSFQ